MKSCGVTIVGGSGYGAGELLRLLSAHPHIEVCEVISRSNAGQPVGAVHSHLEGISDLTFAARVDLARLARYSRNAIILAMPSGRAVETFEHLIRSGLNEKTIVIDLSGDLRLKEESTHTRFYPEVPFAESMRRSFRYGLPELSSERGVRITNPGCLATAAILALAPFAHNSLVGSVVIDAKTGTSGAGREPQASMHHPSRANDFTAYKVLGHRHEPEIVQALGVEFQRNHPVLFVPHLIPVPRGIFVTVYGHLSRAASTEEILARVRDFYRAATFVRVRTAPPRLVDVVGTNFCDISVSARGEQVAVMAAIDNLGKGMAGQAIQNLNREFELPEETGLLSSALGPV